MKPNQPEARPAQQPEVRVAPDAETFRRAAAEDIVKTAVDVLRTRKIFTLALSGGTTPKSLYALLGGEGDTSFRARMPWSQVHLFWTDERPVPADHPDSNYAMVRAAMLEKLSLTKKQVHRIRTEGMNPAQAAHEHQRELKDFFGQHLMLRYDVPRFDMVLLGMGADGHVAGLFPGSESLRERRLLVAAPKPTAAGQQRITLTLPVLNMAVNVLFLVTGKQKAEAVKTALHGPQDPDRCPAQAVKPSDGRVTWIVDRDAAALIT